MNDNNSQIVAPGLRFTAIKLRHSYAPRFIRGVQKSRSIAGFLDSADKPRNVENEENVLNLMAVGLRLVSALIVLFLPTLCAASPDTLFGAIHFDQESVSPALQVFAILTVLSLAPSILIMLSSFTRIIIVLSMLRNALGLQQTPPNSVIISLALFLTLFTMMPVAKIIYADAYEPYQAKTINSEVALKKASEPLREFMLKQTREKDLQLILKLAKEPIPSRAKDIQFYQLIPAFLLSELQTAFQIGFMIFLPFLLIDLIVSGILMTMSMMMMPPMTIALPIKILVFVLIDGFDLVIQALVTSFH